MGEGNHRLHEDRGRRGWFWGYLKENLRRPQAANTEVPARSAELVSSSSGDVAGGWSPAQLLLCSIAAADSASPSQGWLFPDTFVVL